MKRLALFSLLSGLSIVLTGCASIYTAPDFDTYYQAHKTVAIMPFKVSYDPSKLPQEMSQEMLASAQKEEAYSLQQQIYIKFLEREAKNKFTVTFQDVTQTNALLNDASIQYDSLSFYTPQKLRTILNVDAIITGHVRRSKPMSTGAAVAMGVIFGAWGPTNEVNVTVSIHDAGAGTLLWNYEHKLSGSIGSSSEGLAKSLISDISSSFPYKRDRKIKNPQ